MKQQRCKNILDFLFIYQKLFPTRYCLLLLYYIPCPFILPVRMGKNNLINSKMQLHHFVSGIVNGIVFARNWSQGMDLKSQVSDLRTIFLPWKDTFQWNLPVCIMLCFCPRCAKGRTKKGKCCSSRHIFLYAVSKLCTKFRPSDLIIPELNLIYWRLFLAFCYEILKQS